MKAKNKSTKLGDEQEQQEIELLQEKANKGYAEAQFALVKKFLQGVKVTDDFHQVRLWLEQAAAAGLTEAQMELW